MRENSFFMCAIVEVIVMRPYQVTAFSRFHTPLSGKGTISGLNGEKALRMADESVQPGGAYRKPDSLSGEKWRVAPVDSVGEAEAAAAMRAPNGIAEPV
jgi:hypothetical protein